MRGKRRSLVEWGKNALIVLLSISALGLLWQTRFYGTMAEGASGPVGALLSMLPGEEESAAAGTDRTRGATVYPVRMAVMSSQGRAGIQYDNEQVTQLFTDFSNPLAAALAAAETPELSTAEAFQAALQSRNPGVYLDFLGRCPCPIWPRGWAGPGAPRGP